MGGKRKIIRRWPLWIGSMAMLIHLVIPFAQGISAVAFSGSNDDGIPPLVICSALGGIVQISEDGNSKAPSNRPTHDHPAPCSCAFCLNCHSTCQKTNITPSVLTVRLPRIVASIYPQSADDIRIPGWTPTRHRQRAPPSFT